MRKVLVTGASRGIGRATAERFAKAGCALVLVCRKNEELLKEQAAMYLDRYGVASTIYVGDVADPDFVRSIFAAERDIDTVINNAGIAYVGLITDMTDDDYRRVMGTDLDGAFYVCREASRSMVRAHDGRMINITSVWGEAGASTEVAYSAAKAGLIGLTRALAKELAPSGITVNAVSCGLIDTDMNSCFSSEELGEVIEDIPADRIGKPEEVADLIYGVATAPSYMTGQVVRIDGGWM